MINLIISQQIGYGFYKSATITPFDYFHCYINIPDTSSRDSLFQAEARQCLSIINNISNVIAGEKYDIYFQRFGITFYHKLITELRTKK